MQEQKVSHIAKAVMDYQRASCMEVRRKVFIEEQGYDPAVEVDDPEDALSTHFVLVVRGQLAGTVRVNDTNNKLGRFAILPEYRGRGFGIPLVQAVNEHARARGAELVWAEVQADPRPGMDSTGFYAKAGYVPVGDKWNKLGVIHQKMVHSLR